MSFIFLISTLSSALFRDTFLDTLISISLRFSMIIQQRSLSHLLVNKACSNIKSKEDFGLSIFSCCFHQNYSYSIRSQHSSITLSRICLVYQHLHKINKQPNFQKYRILFTIKLHQSSMIDYETLATEISSFR